MFPDLVCKFIVPGAWFGIFSVAWHLLWCRESDWLSPFTAKVDAHWWRISALTVYESPRPSGETELGLPLTLPGAAIPEATGYFRRPGLHFNRPALSPSGLSRGL
jgi:hypothetical protein